MNDSRILRWLDRLDRPRSIESLISEIYGEAALFGTLFEREVADLLNYFDLVDDPLAAIGRKMFQTEDWTLNALIKEVKKRSFISEEEFRTLDDGRDARNELIHRLLGSEVVASRTEKEMLIGRIDVLYRRIWMAHKLASTLKQKYAAKVGVTNALVQDEIQRIMMEAKVEDENMRRVLGDEMDEKNG